MSKHESTARARELGAELRRIREKSGLTGYELGRLLGWSASKISRMESGKRGLPEVDVAIFLARCAAPRTELDRILHLARESDEAYRLQGHGERLPDELRSLIELETTADVIVDYEPGLVPGLLQTEPYIRALLDWGRPERDAGFELRVRARRARQRLVYRQWPPVLGFFVHEHALRASVGGPRVMFEQLLHLLAVAARPRCEIRVVQADAAPVGLFGGSFRLMRFTGHRPVAYAQTHAASVFLEEPEQIRVYRELLDQIAETALNGEQSREWLAMLASEYDRVEIPRDERAGSAGIGLA
ncbi:Helix-turn-helix domain-containing protein [Amycolatopsis marina]|uniref:Helix-turn-helix domain-containing protein n=1 Tax=Amycolatopsis marina TaxID=490629 RepID=A0A1I1BB52_9PSEU|nr:helix-turn-helix transcriptional regulator [Amycolatopsis marina]SFB45743.1 Helix-turn-helix domain-containing protein [Amycolatopsis marina]